MQRIDITSSQYITDQDWQEHFIRSAGPGGQNVNKVATAVQLRFDLANCATLSEPLKTRARNLAGQRLNSEGEIVIEASRHRTQERNRADALERLVDLLKAASIEPKKRKPTRPTLASKKRRLESKTRRSGVKKNRQRPNLD